MAEKWTGNDKVRIKPIRLGGGLSAVQVRRGRRWINVFHNGGPMANIDQPDYFMAQFQGNLNRARGGKIFLPGGEEFQLAHPERHALHEGLPRVLHHRIGIKGNDGTMAQFAMSQSMDAPDYPSPSNYRVVTVYHVQDNSLLTTITIENRGKRPIIGNQYTHMMLNQEIEGDSDPTLQFRAGEHYVLDADCLPTGQIESTIGTALDFSTAKPWGYEWDHCFRGFDGIAVITYARAGFRLTVKDESGNCSRMQVWRSPKFKVSAVEPMQECADCSALAMQHVPGVRVPWLMGRGDTSVVSTRMTFEVE